MENNTEVLLADKQPWASPELAILNVDEFTAHDDGNLGSDQYNFEATTGNYLPS